MIIHPAGGRRDTIRPAVLVDAGHARSLDDGRTYDLDRLPNHLRVYASWDDADELARSGQGELVSWGDEPIRWRHVRHGDSHRRKTDAVIVKLACDTRKDFDHGLAQWADWLHSNDVNPGWSLGGTSMSLLRATLDGPMVTTLGELPPARWTLGGRQQCFVEPGSVIHGAVQLDLPAAYTHVVGQLRYGGAWRRLGDQGSVEPWHRAGFPVLIRANVALPGSLAVGPLHRRPAHRPDSRVEEIAPTVPYPTSGRWQGLWTYNELEQAIAAGVRVRMTDAYVHAGGDLVFQEWHDAVMEGRALPGFAGVLAKATGNALWGQFVIDDRKRLTVQRWNGTYKSMTVQASSGHQVRAWDVGEIVCGTVRAKLYHALASDPDDASLICCHTDGAWFRDHPAMDDVIHDLEKEGWRLKSDVAELRIIDQQKYQYRQRRHRTWTTIFSGVPAVRAADTFDELWGRLAA